MSGGDGKRREIAAALADALALPEAEQLALLPMRESATDDERRRMVEAVKRDRGRPVAARNLATRDALKFVRQVIGDPLIQRARNGMHTPESLSVLLGCTKLEAFDRLDRIQSELALFFYARLAPVDGDGQAVVPSFTLSIGGGSAGAPGARPPWEYLELDPQQTQQNRAFSEPAAPVSHGDVSHEKPK